MKRTAFLPVILVLTAVLILLLALAGHITLTQNTPTEPAEPNNTAGSSQSEATDPTGSTGGDTEPSTAPSVPQTDPTEPSTMPTEPSTMPTEPSTQPTVPSTQPTEPSTMPTDPSQPEELYSRQELEGMSTQVVEYGPGLTDPGVRAPGAVSAQKNHGQYGASFVAEDVKTVYLTFDCGYEYTAVDENGNSYRVTERILDVLKEKDVKGVFFITLSYAQKNPDLVQRMIDEGHAVGNHSASHPVMPNITIDEMVSEVMTLHDYVAEHFQYEMTLFRPPTGAYSVQSLCAVQNLGYENVFWSFAYRDWDTDAQPDPTEAYEHITQSHHNVAIYLLHAISTTNAQVLGDVIDFLRAEGYEIALFQ